MNIAKRICTFIYVHIERLLFCTCVYLKKEMNKCEENRFMYKAEE